MPPATEAVLLNRLIDAHRKRRRIVFLVGAGLSLPPAAGTPGVPGLLAALARGEELTDTSETLSQAHRELAREQLIQRRDSGEGWRVAVPLFARWIREIGAAE